MAPQHHWDSLRCTHLALFLAFLPHLLSVAVPRAWLLHQAEKKPDISPPGNIPRHYRQDFHSLASLVPSYLGL